MLHQVSGHRQCWADNYSGLLLLSGGSGASGVQGHMQVEGGFHLHEEMLSVNESMQPALTDEHDLVNRRELLARRHAFGEQQA